MDLAYVDESGSAGYGSSLTFTLGCVVVPSDRWPDVFDDFIDFRRFIRTRFGVPVRAEIKANYLLHNGGPFGHTRSERTRVSRYTALTCG